MCVVCSLDPSQSSQVHPSYATPVNANVTPATGPVASIQGTSWYGDGNPGTKTVIRYFFGNNASVDGMVTETWTATQKQQFKQALKAWSDVANIDFNETKSKSQAHLIEYVADLPNSDTTLGWHYGPMSGGAEGLYNTDYWTNTNGVAGGYFYTTIVHEIGHALGLAHPHDDGFGSQVMKGVSGPFGDYGTGNLNQGIFSIMSYNDGWHQRNGDLSVFDTFGSSSGLGALDIAAIQAMYGANTSFAKGNDTYTIPDTNGNGTGYKAIWDTGGTDTLVYDGNAQTVIDLRPATLKYGHGGGGYVSFASGIQGGFTIANGVKIEIARGGTAKDTLRGNEFANALFGRAGNDVLQGNQGNDRLFGGAGKDFLNGGQGNDLMYGQSDNDRIFGNIGNDRAFGGSGRDTLFGGQDNDRLYGQADNDRIYGQYGRDTLYGNQGDDVLFGGNVRDAMNGGTDNDRLFGGKDDDYLNGASGDDFLSGDQGNDSLVGAGGSDIFGFTRGHDHDTIRDFTNGVDKIDLSKYNGINDIGDLSFSQSSGNTTITLFSGDSIVLINVTPR